MFKMKRFFWLMILPLSMLLVQCESKTDKEPLEERIPAPDMDPALVRLNKNIRTGPNNPENYHERARYFMGQERYDEAMVDMRSVFKLDTNNANYFYTTGELYIKIGAFDQADDVLGVATAKNPSLAKAHVKRGELAFYNKLYNSAMKYINDGLRADVNFAEGYFWKGMVYLEQNDKEKATSSFLTTIEQNPEYTEAYMQLALLNLDEAPILAHQYLSNVLLLDAQHIEALYARGILVQRQGYPDSALADYDKILSITSDHFDATYNTGYVHLLQERYDDAVAWFSKALEISYNDHRAIYNRGLAYEMRGDKDLAQQDYRNALKIEPGFDLALQGINRLK